MKDLTRHFIDVLLYECGRPYIDVPDAIDYVELKHYCEDRKIDFEEIRDTLDELGYQLF